MKFENTKVFGLQNAIIGMRLPMCKDFAEAKSKADVYPAWGNELRDFYDVGNGELELAKKLIKADVNAGYGQPNAKFLRMVHVQVCITAPAYWWQEFDTYKVGVTRNSTSLQHTGTKRDFVASDFDVNIDIESSIVFNELLEKINELRKEYVETKNNNYFLAMRSLIPSSYNYTCMVDFNYQTIRNMYKQRKGHKLAEWQKFNAWVLDELPFAKELIGDLK